MKKVLEMFGGIKNKDYLCTRNWETVLRLKT